MLIREHRRSDADRIAEILAAGWAQSYSAFMPKEFLAPRIDAELRRVEIADWLDTEFDTASEVIFVAEVADDIAGFIHVELGDKGDLGATGIVNLLYVDPVSQGRGIGRQLLASGAQWLVATAPGPLVLSAFADNRSRGFYDSLGGTQAKRVQHAIAGKTIESVLYLWPLPAALVDVGRPAAHSGHRPR
jgi:GNAT superfamily N-acetyltransferase